MHRYFFAIFPDHEARTAIAARAEDVRRTHSLRGRLIAGSKLHLTWHFIGSFNEPGPDIEQQATAVGDALRCPPFRFTLDHTVCFGRGRKLIGEPAPCAFGATTTPAEMVAGSEFLARQSQPFAGPGSARFPFRPHVTWMYSKDRIRAAAPIEPVEWTVTEFCLAQSGQGRGDYRTLKRWPLRSA